MAPFNGNPGHLSTHTLELLDRAFTDTWWHLQSKESSFACLTREIAAQDIMRGTIDELAAAGVRDLERLKRHTLRGAERATPGARKVLHLPL